MQSWDTGISADPRYDFFFCMIRGFRDRDWYLLDLWRWQLDFPDLKAKALEQAARWGPDPVLIEDVATGRRFFQKLFMNDKRYQKVEPRDPKEIRFTAA